MTTLKASRPTLEAFAPYGTLLTKPLGTSTLERPDITYWHGTADLADLGSSGVTGYLSAYQREAILHSIERHRQTCEVFIPLLGRSLFVVAPPGEPDMALARAFVLEPGSSILLHRAPGTGHPFPSRPQPISCSCSDARPLSRISRWWKFPPTAWRQLCKHPLLPKKEVLLYTSV